MLAGCISRSALIDRALLAHPAVAVREENPVPAYTVTCPDVLELQVAGRPDLTGHREVGPDGRISLGVLGRLRVEGLPITAIANHIAQVAVVPPAAVHVQILAYNSRQIFVSGQVVGLQRAVEYRGPEPVLDLLQRAGGITPGAAPDEVYVVRSHMAEDRQPEVFRVDLRAILMRDDSRSNIYLRPMDQVFVGETRRCTFEKCLPPWVRPLYESFCGLRQPKSASNIAK
jgi:protein involved in polysaccharide export with SLBB domain